MARPSAAKTTDFFKDHLLFLGQLVRRLVRACPIGVLDFGQAIA
jgi:hypothetical protein